MGQLPPGAITLVETLDDVARARARRTRRTSPMSRRRRSRSTTRARSSRRCRRAFPTIVGPHKEDICYATTNRQEAVKRVAPQVDAHDRRRLAELVELAAPARGRRARRLPARAARPARRRHRLGRLRRHPPRSASRPAPRRPRCWSRRSSTPSPSATRSSVETVSTADESVFFPLPRELRGEAAE